MHVFHPDLAARAVPRYTSYPTAVEFSDRIGAAEQESALGALSADDRATLYVHIPFCREICWYCGCNTGAIGRGERLAAYIDALDREIATTGALTRARIHRVQFGGGSPNALSPDQFATLAAALRRHFAIAPDAEWSVELDPRTLSETFVSALAMAGVTRASLGVQTTSPFVQAAIGRIQPLRTIASAMQQLRSTGIARVNVDLLYGLPCQTVDDIAATVAALLPLAPDRVAMFGYAHAPRLFARQRRIDAAALPDARARFWQSALAHDLLAEAGYRAIGFDHFARADDPLVLAADEGRLHRNFQGFTDDDGCAVVGIGASAISSFPGLLVQNEKAAGAYRLRVANGLAGVRGVRRERGDRLRGAVIERLLCDGIVDVAAVAAAQGGEAAELIDAWDALAPLAARGLVRLGDWSVEITTEGRPYARLAAAAFDAYRAPAGRFSRAV